ncbi:MAG: hypothetical protein U0L05_01225 [Schaedlerella sp.]|nr:hypothetical protein [Schaedlerella sp.]
MTCKEYQRYKRNKNRAKKRERRKEKCQKKDELTAGALAWYMSPFWMALVIYLLERGPV